MIIERIYPTGLYRPPTYSPVVKAGNTIYIAGQTAMDVSGSLVGKGDIKAQVAQVFRNIMTALASVGASYTNLVKVTTYLTSAANIEGYRTVRSQFLINDLPASTLLVIKGLARADMLVEIDAIAVVE